MKSTKQLIEQLEKLSNKKVILKAPTTTPSIYKLNQLVTQRVWDVFMSEMHRVYKGSGVQVYNPERVKQLSGEQLNSGYCHWIAWAINKLDKSYIPKDTSDYRAELRNSGCKHASDHAFVIKGGRFYDAEAPNGVNNVWELPYFIRLVTRKKFR